MFNNQPPLNILMTTPRYFPDTGGTEMHVHEVGRRLAQRGMNVTLLTTFPHHYTAPVPVEEEVEGMKVIRVQAWRQPSDFYIAPDIHSFMKRGHWDLIHCQGCHTLFSPMVMLAARAEKIPYIATFHSGGHSSRLRTTFRATQWKLLRPLLADAEKLIGVSEFETNYFRDLLHLPEKQFSVIPNGFSVPEGSYPEVEASSANLIVSVGRLERYKGHQHLIAALPKIREARPDARLAILGAGPYEAALHEMARKLNVAEHVTIRAIPASNREEMMALLSQASLVTLLSEYESQGIAIMEALALHRPVLVADTSALREYAQKNLARAVSPDSTPEELAAAVLDQLSNPLIPAQLNLPTWDDCAEQLYRLYHTVVRKPSYAL
ncbi:glycosyltransferase family 4 protein [Dictyobacter arantiisoli]|uniref:N-acetylglucosaminyl-phosphatidylinositol biosynthetic protein Spt14 n=1 Tax=Dictyobacter arantiisoli TaxID=2014874 RepID=A0A5A5TGJ5_9CHLR|nr:glycosyltransferase family 4 protein [Dictyobacter arantiisoli]GCF10149.1 N-acetylglucosaminyl-phosphatidylinositol biosynthetic protein Spt14 [Dictyobacter arantiisoli]